MRYVCMCQMMAFLWIEPYAYSTAFVHLVGVTTAFEWNVDLPNSVADACTAATVAVNDAHVYVYFRCGN